MGAEESTQQQKQSGQEQGVSFKDTEEEEQEELKEYKSEEIQKWFNCNFPVHISGQVFELKQQMTTIRRYFHKNPELSYEEYNTSKTIVQCLRKLKFDVVTEGVAKTGVVGLLRGDNPGPCILLRSDMDALPVTEQNDVDFKSTKEGVMHACGHDCHMSILLSTAEILSKLRHHIHGSVKFVFQPAEEGGAGAKKMIEEGVLENPHVDQVYGLHVWSYDPFGTVHCRAGPLMAGAAQFRIAVQGVGGHAAVPNGTKDAVVAVAQLVTQLHTIVPRNVSPLDSAVLTIGKISSGYRSNVIADEGILEGTIRYLRDEVRQILVDRMNDICKGIELSFGVKTELQWEGIPYPPTINHKSGFDHVKLVAEQVLPEGFRECPPTMAAEDFSFFLQERSGAFFFVGCGVEGDAIHAHHKPTFQVDERCLPIGCQIMTLLVLELLMAPRKEDNEVVAATTDEKLVQLENQNLPARQTQHTTSQLDQGKQKEEGKNKTASNHIPVGNGISGNATKEE